MKDPLLDDGPLSLYQRLPVRKDWNHPTREDIADSLRKAHEVNRKLIVTVNELIDARKKMKKDMDDLDRELRQSRLRATILTSVLSSASTATFIGGLVTLFRAFAK